MLVRGIPNNSKIVGYQIPQAGNQKISLEELVLHSREFYYQIIPIFILIMWQITHSLYFPTNLVFLLVGGSTNLDS